MFNDCEYVKGLQKHRASLAFRDEKYDRVHAAAARSPAVRKFYEHEAGVDHEFGMARLRSAKGSGVLNVHPRK